MPERFTEIDRRVLGPTESQALVPALADTANPAVWVYHYSDRATGWTLSIATHAEPGSGKLSLGGFRIAPEARTSIPGYDNDAEAIGLAMGMEEKIYWSRLIKAGGPLGLRNVHRLVGGKCVLLPTPHARVGQPRDAALLDFAIAMCKEFEAASGAYLVTGQDLGHGVMSDGATESLQYMHERFRGSVLADTAVPTGEGNYHLLRGLLDALRIPMAEARVGLIGFGNIGRHVFERLREHGTGCVVLEASEAKRQQLGALGVSAFAPDRKDEFLHLPVDALAINAAGGTLDPASVEIIVQNPTIRAITGCENLVMPDPSGAAMLQAARKLYVPTELGGMMGYLTAVEEYLARQEGVPFEMDTMLEAARRLAVAGYEAAEYVLRREFAVSFEDAVREVFSSTAVIG